MKNSANIGYSLCSPYSHDTDSDVRVRSLIQAYIPLGCNFICYPIGGLQRYNWTPNRLPPPKINLPDLQMPNMLWMSRVSCCVSSWIHCDSDQGWISSISISALEEELSHVAYLGLKSVSISLKNLSSPKLAQVVSKWLWQRQADFSFWIIVPTNILGLGEQQFTDTDIWSVWADFRTLCGNYPGRLFVGIKFSEDSDEEFSVPSLFNRWKTEPVGVVWLDSTIFSDGTLPSFHSRFLKEVWTDDSYPRYIMLGSQKNCQNLPLASIPQLVHTVLSAIGHSDGSTDDGGVNNAEFTNTLQVPLQPLSVNLDSVIYNTFEQDNAKYKLYGRAIRLALEDLITKSLSNENEAATAITAFVVGAGRGPLISLLLEAESDLSNRSPKKLIPLNIFAVEKNPSACLSLEFCNTTRWNNRVTVLECDMRQLSEKFLDGAFPSPDIIISELLGSFGDNELCPECISSLLPITTKNTIFIPQSYKNYVAPIQSLRMHQNVISSTKDYWSRQLAGSGHNVSSETNPADSLYVVCLPGDYCLLGGPTGCFEFIHPSESSNTRQTTVSFDFTHACELMGFAGYFDACLYKDVYLSTVPGQHSKEMPDALTKQGCGMNGHSLTMMPKQVKLFELLFKIKTVLHNISGSTLNNDIS
uniref:Protein arginine N-methyltransferase n=1 Tax=Ditylenchus dipsaci TaxID=166011 RepID=A0A915CTD9_9BILA